MNISEKLKEIRLYAKKSQQEFAKMAGLSLMSIRRYENGERTPTMHTIEEISKKIEISIDYFFDRGAFENIDLLLDFKAVILYELADRSVFFFNDRAITEISEFEYFKYVSKYVDKVYEEPSGRTRIDYNAKLGAYNADPQMFVDAINEQLENKRRYVKASISLNFDEVLSAIDKDGNIVSAYFILREISSLNKFGIEEAVKQIEHLLTNDDYKKD